jgi:hypothetical protein
LHPVRSEFIAAVLHGHATRMRITIDRGVARFIIHYPGPKGKPGAHIGLMLLEIVRAQRAVSLKAHRCYLLLA